MIVAGKRRTATFSNLFAGDLAANWPYDPDAVRRGMRWLPSKTILIARTLCPKL